MIKRLLGRSAIGVAAVVLGGCGLDSTADADLSSEDTGESVTEALTANTAPVAATIVDGVGAAGAVLGMTKEQVAAHWGLPTNCSASAAEEVCIYKSADGVHRVEGRFNAESPRRLSALSVWWWYNQSWATLKGIKTGSTAAEVFAAYNGSIDVARSTDSVKVVPGVDAFGRPSLTQFGLATLNEYTPNQYLGVFKITVKSDVVVPVAKKSRRR